MKKLIFAFASMLVAGAAWAAETIVVLNPQGPTHSGTVHTMRMIEIANQQQNKYKFVPEFKVGAFESIALKSLVKDPQTTLSTMTPPSAEGMSRGFVSLEDFVPVFSQGDSCWGLLAVTGKGKNRFEDLKGMKEFVVGGPGYGSATHLTALAIGDQMGGIKVRYVIFKSAFDAFQNMVSNQGVNFVLERVTNYNQFRAMNPNIEMVAMSCPTRHPAVPNVKTLAEHGIVAPYIFQFIVGHRDLSPARRKEFHDIFQRATDTLGRDKIMEISDQSPPQFRGMNSEQHYRESWQKLLALRKKYADKFTESAQR